MTGLLFREGGAVKKVLIGLICLFLLLGCYRNISQVEYKWGPPGKVEDRGETLVYYYYFYRGRGIGYDPGYGGGVTLGRVTAGIVVVEITTDKTGKILKKRKYWKQPETK